jgi:hypothetical protein
MLESNTHTPTRISPHRPHGGLSSAAPAEQAADGAVLSSSPLEAFSKSEFATAITLLGLDLTIATTRGNHLLRGPDRHARLALRAG